MKYFFGAVIGVVLTAILFLVFYHPVEPSTQSAFTGTQVYQALNLYRQSKGLLPLGENGNLQKTVDAAIAQVGQLDSTDSQGVQVRLDTNSTALFSGYRILEADGFENVSDVISYWATNADSAIILSPSFNITGLSTGRSRDGVQYVYGMVAYCQSGC
jgi:hypothetical protein